MFVSPSTIILLTIEITPDDQDSTIWTTPPHLLPSTASHYKGFQALLFLVSQDSSSNALDFTLTRAQYQGLLQQQKPNVDANRSTNSS